MKLPAAAEQLPAVLDAARAEELSLTTALERLLDLEVQATEDRRLTGRLRFTSTATATAYAATTPAPQGAQDAAWQPASRDSPQERP